MKIITILLYTYFCYIASDPYTKTFQFKKVHHGDEIRASVYYDNNTQKFRFSEEYDENAVAYGLYSKTLETLGWDFISISSNIEPRYNAKTKAYAMGYLEGVLTKDRIFSHYINTKNYVFSETNGEMPEYMRNFFNKHHNYIVEMSQMYPYDPYWTNAYMLYMQLNGMVDGYNSSQEKERQINIINFQVIASTGELDDIKMTNKEDRVSISKMNYEQIIEYIHSRTHCSVLLKVTPDFSDIFLGHNTWSNYSFMTRIFKEYRFKAGIENSFSVTFSSYPGALNSIDDFYITDKDIVVTETTNAVFTESLFDKISPNSMLCWERAMIANRLAIDAKGWTELFARYNSGTYNNQFIILDLKLIDLELKVIKDNAFWIIEQIPGYTEAADMTQILRYGYWPSYNSPYFQTIRELSGYQEQISKHPKLKDTIDYNTCARAIIFRRDHSLVTDLNDIKTLLRYNDYKNDIDSKNNPSLAISQRKDLDESNPQCIGGLDSKVLKISDIKLSKEKKIYIISGPTYDNLPVFEFSKANCDISKLSKVGLPDKYNFSWVEYSTSLFEIERTKFEADY